MCRVASGLTIPGLSFSILVLSGLYPQVPALTFLNGECDLAPNKPFPPLTLLWSGYFITSAETNWIRPLLICTETVNHLLYKLGFLKSWTVFQGRKHPWLLVRFLPCQLCIYSWETIMYATEPWLYTKALSLASTLWPYLKCKHSADHHVEELILGANTADVNSLLQENLSCKCLQKKKRKAQGREERVVIGETLGCICVAVSSRVKAVHLRTQDRKRKVEQRDFYVEMQQ